MFARCDRCGETFLATREGAQRCAHCGAEVIVGEAPSPPGEPSDRPGDATAKEAPAGPDTPAAPPGHDSPLAERGDAGPLVPFLRTVALALFRPAELFVGMRTDHARGAFAFGWGTTALAVLFGFLWQGIGVEPSPIPLSPDDRRANALLGIVIGPLLAGGLFALWLLVIRWSLRLLGGEVRGRAATLRAVGYGSAPLVWLAIPGIGGVVATAWSLVLTARAIGWLHGIRPGRAIAAVLLPWGVAAVLLPLLAQALLGSGLVPRG